jgi:D-serine deaminase-like pyridoxal phosphate-dependent protein
MATIDGSLEKPWYQLDNVEELDTPALVIFPDRVKHNIHQAISMVGDVSRLRPHVKTHKCAEVAALMIEAGITKFKCATIAEAEMLCMEGAPDVLMAYQPGGPKLKRFISLIRNYKGTRLSCLVDNVDSAREQSAQFEAAGLKVDVYIDLNVGMNRTGIAPGEKALALYQLIDALPGLNINGLHAYDGHIREKDFEAKKAACDKAFAQVEALKEAIEAKGMATPVIIVGGSPSFSVHSVRSGVECSPGTFIYWDYGYNQLCPEQLFLPAAILVTRVISLPTHTRVCTDLGHKSVAAENEIGKRVSFLNASGLFAVGQSEEHLVLETAAGHSFQPGQVLYALPYHICPTVALYEKVYIAAQHHIADSWRNAARDRQIGC